MLKIELKKELKKRAKEYLKSLRSSRKRFPFSNGSSDEKRFVKMTNRKNKSETK